MLQGQGSQEKCGRWTKNTGLSPGLPRDLRSIRMTSPDFDVLTRKIWGSLADAGAFSNYR